MQDYEFIINYFLVPFIFIVSLYDFEQKSIPAKFQNNAYFKDLDVTLWQLSTVYLAKGPLNFCYI